MIISRFRSNDTMILDSDKLSQLTANTTGSWQVNQDLPTGQKLRVRVKGMGSVWRRIELV
ncbi:hypothetical protein ACVNS2_06495 [Paenibacillus caseinilyticus]|uniref:Uncharacterized protein n=1 Tax=Paenibacillus mucilaginosus K02 TaxID=997761 RepID=I0BD78_9BACL|nr:hypothetical protein [Paenibacillus mucilaginosus]AFH60325.2 hypothetical protein B2K_06230 [Paenibacillus mucilaginosus K02]